jgi:hypothetical protein
MSHRDNIYDAYGQHSRVTSSRVLAPGGTGGKSSISFGDDDDSSYSRSPQRSMRQNRSNVFGGDDDAPPPTHRPPNSRGQVNRSTVFSDTDDDPVRPHIRRIGERSTLTVGEDPAAGDPVHPPMTHRVLQPGGAGGRSRVFSEDEDEDRSKTHIRRIGERSTLTVGEDPAAGEPTHPPLTHRVLQPGGAGGRSRVFSDDDEEPVPRPSVRSRSRSPFAMSDEDTPPQSPPTSGRRTAGRSANTSNIVFGDDGGEVTSSRNRISSRVLNPGGTGGRSNIVFGDDSTPVDQVTDGLRRTHLRQTEDDEVQPSARSGMTTSSRVLQPGGTGGKSSVVFGDDRTSAGLSVDDDSLERSRAARTGRGGIRNPNVSQWSAGDDDNTPQRKANPVFK